MRPMMNSSPSEKPNSVTAMVLRVCAQEVDVRCAKVRSVASGFL